MIIKKKEIIMIPIQIKHFDLPLQSGYYKGSSEYYLRNIWLKIKEKNEGLSLSLMCNELNNKKLKINLLISKKSLDKMESRFQKKQYDFQIFTLENGNFKTLKIVFSNQVIKSVNGRERLPSSSILHIARDRIIDIAGVNFSKIADLHQGRPDNKYENVLRAYSSINLLIGPMGLFKAEMVLLIIIVGTFLRGIRVLNELGMGQHVLLVALISAIVFAENLPAINEGPHNRGINCLVGNRHISCFHIQDNMITIYQNPYYSEIISKLDKIFNELAQDYSAKNIDLKLKNIMPHNYEHVHLHNFNDFSRLPFLGHNHHQFVGIPFVNPELLQSFIAKLTADNLIDVDTSASILKKFKRAFIG